MKKLLFLILVCLCLNSLAQEEYNYLISCSDRSDCDSFIENFTNKLEGVKDESLLLDIIKEMILVGDIESLSYVIDGRNVKIDVDLKEIINDVSLKIDSDVVTIDLSDYQLREGVFIQDIDLDKVKSEIEKNLKDRGFLNSRINFDIKKNDGRISIKSNIATGDYLKISQVGIRGLEERSKRIFIAQGKAMLGKPYSRSLVSKFKLSILAHLESNGYYFSLVACKDNHVSDLSIFLDCNVEKGKKIIVGLAGNNLFPTKAILGDIKDNLKRSKEGFTDEFIEEIIIQKYEERGHYDTSVSIIRYKNKFSETLNITINEGHKIVVDAISFIGNKKISTSALSQIYNDSATALAISGFFDEAYLLIFENNVRSHYLKRGYIFVNVSKAFIKYAKNKKSVSIEYTIDEGIQSILKDINITDISESERKKVLSNLVNRVGKPLNVVEVESDIRLIEQQIKAMGYFFARIIKNNPAEVLKYSKDYKQSVLDINLASGPKIHFNKFRSYGNRKTRNAVIRREIHLKKGDVVRPADVDKIFERIQSLGLFSFVEVTPVRSNKQVSDVVDLIIKVKERDFGGFEIAPGYRTDIGLKVSSKLSLNNLNGKNRAASLSGQLNQRLDFDTIQVDRRGDDKDMIEFDTKLSFTEPYLFKLPLDFTAATSLSRERYFSFDADIFEFNASLRKNFNDIFSASLKYQFEDIRQYNATADNLIDNDSFTIGSMTPTLTLDLRDNKIVPTKGAYFQFSTEFANPGLASQSRDDSTIDFYKIITRNHFYVPMYKYGVLAISLTGGFQKNLADEELFENDGTRAINDDGVPQTNGRIPTIKVFRLRGIDRVRGFDDTEINRLIEGEDISDVIVQSKLYFSNIKVEPRFYLSESLMLNLFYDAGRIFVDSFKPFKLRQAVGVGLKLITPVGTLNFDYGFKLKRKKLPGGNREKPGKFHVSIGFF